jgi:hypothetical protein
MSQSQSAVSAEGTTVYTESGRVSVRLTGEGYRKSDTMDDWEGIP